MNNRKNILFDNTLLEVFLHIKYLNSNAYIVGGCVRDLILNRPVNDYDIVTDCNLDLLNTELLKNGWNVVEAGKQFLVTIVSKNGIEYEISNFRKDGTYSDGRRPDFVEIGDLESDSIRRDLTINSLYMCPYSKEILDPTKKGLSDIKNCLIRMNGRADDRIKEDKLRIMRVYRFSNQLGFKIEKRTLKACRKYFNEMYSQVSPERVKNEIEKMCTFE